MLQHQNIDKHPEIDLNGVIKCLAYLPFGIFKTDSCPSDEQYKERPEESKFLDYAAKHWREHASTIEDDVRALSSLFPFTAGWFR
jgi:hypothetical protein